MASLVDVENEPGDVEGLEKSLTEAVTADNRPEDQKTNKMEPSEVSQDPLKGTKFEGKGVDEILDSYNNLQSAYGRMANDLGTQRKLTDQLLDLKRDNDLQSNAPDPLPSVDPAKLLDDPTQALDGYLAEREARNQRAYDERLAQMEAQMQADRFMQKHPDFMDVGQSEEFRSWAQATPVRNTAANLAAQGDWNAADALLNEYKAEMANKPAPVDSAAKEGIEAAKQVGLESAASEGSSGSGKVYRRADLIELKLRKPHVYGDPSFQAEILKAYSEGRVK
jgi:hypothetical protein